MDDLLYTRKMPKGSLASTSALLRGASSIGSCTGAGTGAGCTGATGGAAASDDDEVLLPLLLLDEEELLKEGERDRSAIWTSAIASSMYASTASGGQSPPSAALPTTELSNDSPDSDSEKPGKEALAE